MKHILLISFFMTCSYAVMSDVIDDGDKQYYGKVISVTSGKIILKVSCTGANQEFLWKNVRMVTFSKECNHPGWDMSTSPVQAETDCPKKTLFVLSITSHNELSYADQFSIKDGTLTIHYANGKGNKQLPAKDLHQLIEWVSLRTMCEADVPANFPML